MVFSHGNSKVTNTTIFKDLSLPYKFLRFMDIEMHTQIRPKLPTHKESSRSRQECRLASLHLSTSLVSLNKIYYCIHKILFAKLVLKFIRT